MKRRHFANLVEALMFASEQAERKRRRFVSEDAASAADDRVACSADK